MHLVRQFISELMRCVLSCRVVPLDLSLGTSKRARMFPRLVRGIYVMQFCYVTDLGID